MNEDSESSSSTLNNNTSIICLTSNLNWSRTIGEEQDQSEKIDENDDWDLVPEKPLIPDHLDLIRWREMPLRMCEKMAFALDVDALGDLVRNWEWLAEALGLKANEIQYIKMNYRPPKSPINILIENRFPNESLGKVLRLIRDHLQRYDVIIELTPFFAEFETRQNNVVVVKSPEEDSGILNPEWQQLNNRSEGNSQSSQPERPSTSKSTGSNVKKRLKDHLILLTYFADDPEHQTKIDHFKTNLITLLTDNVKTDVDILNNNSHDLQAGFDNAFKKANQIIVVCSKNYQKYIDSTSKNCKESENSQEIDSQLNKYRRYLLKLMSQEYHSNDCQNFRFRPVIIGSSEDCKDRKILDKKLVPFCLQNTIIHRWPEEHQQFMKLCVKMGEFCTKLV